MCTLRLKHTHRHSQADKTKTCFHLKKCIQVQSTNILLMLQNNIIAAKGALCILWSTAGIKDLKKRHKLLVLLSNIESVILSLLNI